VTSMSTIRPILRRIVDARQEGNIIADRWEESYEHVPGCDITADKILVAIAELRAERDEMEVLKARPENEDVGQ
jgi:hypothetical protein